MRFFPTLLLSFLINSSSLRAHAQNAPAASPPAIATPAAAAPAPTPAAAAPTAPTPAEVAQAAVVTPTEPAAPSGPASITSIEPAVPSAGATQAGPLQATATAPTDRKLANADAWVAFELKRDLEMQRRERLGGATLLGLEAALGAAVALTGEDISTTARALMGSAGVVAAAALVPSMLTSSRDARRIWIGAGSTSFSLLFSGAVLADSYQGGDHMTRWLAGALAVQSLALVPISLIPGYPSERDYEAYTLLPAEARPDAAVRLLLQIDRYEQRATAVVLLTNVLSAAVLGAGMVIESDPDDRRLLGAFAAIPCAVSVLAAIPRLFVASRSERFQLGQAPKRLPFNFW